MERKTLGELEQRKMSSDQLDTAIFRLENGKNGTERKKREQEVRDALTDLNVSYNEDKKDNVCKMMADYFRKYPGYNVAEFHRMYRAIKEKYKLR